MKKKKTLYLMLPLIIMVWGFVFYQLFSYFFSSPTFANPEPTTKINIDEIKRDTFSIVADYRDPFLGKNIRLTEHKSNSNISPVKAVSPNKNAVADQSWPNIEYHGMIKNNNSDRRVGIVKINGKEYLAKEGEILKEVTILEINKQQVKVRFLKESRTIIK